MFLPFTVLGTLYLKWACGGKVDFGNLTWEDFQQKHSASIYEIHVSSMGNVRFRYLSTIYITPKAGVILPPNSPNMQSCIIVSLTF